MNVLISSISSNKAVVVARFIKKHYKHVEIVGFDSRWFSRFYRTKYIDRFHFLPSGIDDYVAWVAEIVEREKIDLLLPIDSNELAELLANRERLHGALDYMGALADFHRLNNKLHLHQLATDLGIKVPRAYKTFDDAAVPCVTKPSSLSSSCGVRYFFDREALDRARPVLGQQRDLVVQEYIDGVGIGYSLFAKNGSVITGFGHKRLAEFPVSGGSSVYRENYFDPRAREIAAQLMAATGWSGFAMVEFKLTASGDLYLIEVNPRLWGSINQGLENGINYFSELLGQTPGLARNHLRQMKTYMPLHLGAAFGRYLLRRRPGPLLDFLGSLLGNRADVGIWSDPLGWLSVVSRALL